MAKHFHAERRRALPGERLKVYVVVPRDLGKRGEIGSDLPAAAAVSYSEDVECGLDPIDRDI